MKLKTGLALGLSCVAALLTGCFVLSVYPYYTAKEVVFEKGLVGTWTKAEEPGEHWKFEKGEADGYQLTVSGPQNTNVMQAHLFKLKGQYFLDVFAPDANSDIAPPPIPSHMLLRAYSLTPNVKLSALEHSWLRDLLAKDPKALRHEVPQTKDKPEDRPIVLTADTAELQAFVSKYLDTTNAWSEPFELKQAETAGK